MELAAAACIVGIGATAVTDVWAWLRTRLLSIPPPDYGLVGRWVAHMPRGRFRHESIKAAAPVRYERALGWVVHYAIGVSFAALLLSIYGLGWLDRPTIVPALIVGVGTVAAPFLVMQPAMGAGVAASRTPRPNAARLQSLVMHAVFGIGLYAAAWLMAWVR